ncbi:MAG: hypothetical protein GF307_02980 [candidate division Zixibacteria bacterium]|nr:hypothetical protein [candidate division Zixibacteria bacterium]
MKKVLLLAEEHFGDAIKGFIGDRYEVSHLTNREWKSKAFLSKMKSIITSDYIHHFGGTESKTLINTCALLSKKLIIQFTGTDVYNILRKDSKRQQEIRKLYSKVWRLAAVSENLAAELRAVSIENVEVVSFAVKFDMPRELNITPENSALSYIPEGNEDFYGWEQVKELIMQFPDVQFYILANSGIMGFRADNVQFTGWVEKPEEYISKVKVYLRHTKHDGLPNMVMQSLLHGRQVLYNGKFPYCRDFTKGQFRQCIENWEPNIEGQRYIIGNFSRDKIVEGYIKLYD